VTSRLRTGKSLTFFYSVRGLPNIPTFFICLCNADDLDELVLSYMTKENGDWVCTACGFTKRRKDYVVDHVEAKVRLPFSYRFYDFLGN
jgi:hypothetical protein